MTSRLSSEEETAYEAGYMTGAEATRAGIAADLRDVLGRLLDELIAIRRALGLPPPDPLDEPSGHQVNGRSKPQ